MSVSIDKNKRKRGRNWTIFQNFAQRFFPFIRRKGAWFKTGVLLLVPSTN